MGYDMKIFIVAVSLVSLSGCAAGFVAADGLMLAVDGAYHEETKPIDYAKDAGRLALDIFTLVH
jgi:hypothetical protein